MNSIDRLELLAEIESELARLEEDPEINNWKIRVRESRKSELNNRNISQDQVDFIACDLGYDL